MKWNSFFTAVLLLSFMFCFQNCSNANFESQGINGSGGDENAGNDDGTGGDRDRDGDGNPDSNIDPGDPSQYEQIKQTCIDLREGRRSSTLLAPGASINGERDNLNFRSERLAEVINTSGNIYVLGTLDNSKTDLVTGNSANLVFCFMDIGRLENNSGRIFLVDSKFDSESNNTQVIQIGVQ